MKPFLLFFISIFVTVTTIEAQVAINSDGTTAHSDAILDVKSTTKGLLFPRMTYAQRMAITTPPSGLMVYQTDTDPSTDFPFGFYVVSGGSWKRLESNTNPFQPSWRNTSGDPTKQYSLSEKVGIGVTDPSHLLHLRGDLNHILLEGGLAVVNFRTPLNGGYQTSGRLYGSSNDMVLGTGLANPGGRLYFELGASRPAYFDSDGSFRTKSDIFFTQDDFTTKGFIQQNNSDFRLGTVSSNNTGNIVFRANGADAVKITPVGDLVPLNAIQFLDGTTEKTFIHRSVDDLRLGTNSGNTLGNLIVRLNGANRYQFAPTGRMTIFADQNPTLYFNTGNSNRAYLQLQGDDIKIDAPGNKVNIGDDMTVNDATGYVGIGTTTPEYKLHVAGTGVIKANSGKVLNNNNENLLPIAYATFSHSNNFEKLSGTSNISCGWILGGSVAICGVDVAGVDISNSVVSITVRNSNLKPSWYPSGSGISIRFYDDDGDERGPVSFSIIIYKPN